MSNLDASKNSQNDVTSPFIRTSECLPISEIQRISEQGVLYPLGFRGHVKSCAHCTSMIKAASRLYDERQIWEQEQDKVVVLSDVRRVWPSPDVVLKKAAGARDLLWSPRIALPPIVFTDHNLRIELDVIPLGSPPPKAAEQPTPVPDSVELLATATTLGGEPLENLNLTVRLADEPDTPVISGCTDDEGCIASDEPFEGERLLSQSLTIEVQDESGDTGQH